MAQHKHPQSNIQNKAAPINNTYSDRSSLIKYINKRILFTGNFEKIKQVKRDKNNINVTVVASNIRSPSDINIKLNHMNLAFSISKRAWSETSKNLKSIHFYGTVRSYEHNPKEVLDRLFAQIEVGKIHPEPYPYKTFGITDIKIQQTQ